MHANRDEMRLLHQILMLPFDSASQITPINVKSGNLKIFDFSLLKVWNPNGEDASPWVRRFGSKIWLARLWWFYSKTKVLNKNLALKMAESVQIHRKWRFSDFHTCKRSIISHSLTSVLSLLHANRDEMRLLHQILMLPFDSASQITPVNVKSGNLKIFDFSLLHLCCEKYIVRSYSSWGDLGRKYDLRD